VERAFRSPDGLFEGKVEGRAEGRGNSDVDEEIHAEELMTTSTQPS
jgi:hypothetical protein